MNAPSSTQPTVEGRWTVFVCTGCGECTGRHNACDAKREATPVVPCDEAAIERAMPALAATDSDYRYVSKADLRAAVVEVLRAAGAEA